MPRQSQRCLHLLAYWRSKRGERDVPRRDTLDPVLEIPSLLAHLILVDVEDQDRYRFRLIGSQVVERAGRNATGRLIDGTLYDDDTLREALRCYGRAVEQRQPIMMHDFATREFTRPRSTTLVAPLADANGTVVQLIGAIDYATRFDVDFAAHAIREIPLPDEI